MPLIIVVRSCVKEYYKIYEQGEDENSCTIKYQNMCGHTKFYVSFAHTT